LTKIDGFRYESFQPGNQSLASAYWQGWEAHSGCKDLCRVGRQTPLSHLLFRGGS